MDTATLLYASDIYPNGIARRLPHRLVLQYLTGSNDTKMPQTCEWGVLDNGEQCVLWLGQSVSPQIILDLFDVNAIEKVSRAVSLVIEPWWRCRH